MWHQGLSKVGNLDIIGSYTGRSGNPIRTQQNVLECSVTTSANFLEGAAGSGTHISSFHHHKYQTFMFLIIPPALPLCLSYITLSLSVCVFMCVRARVCARVWQRQILYFLRLHLCDRFCYNLPFR